MSMKRDNHSHTFARLDRTRAHARERERERERDSHLHINYIIYRIVYIVDILKIMLECYVYFFGK